MRYYWQLVEVVVIFIVIYEFLQEIWMRLHARNPRKTTRADTAQNADARKTRVLLILLVIVVAVVVVVVVVVEVEVEVVVVVVIIRSQM